MTRIMNSKTEPSQCRSKVGPRSLPFGFRPLSNMTTSFGAWTINCEKFRCIPRLCQNNDLSLCFGFLACPIHSINSQITGYFVLIWQAEETTEKIYNLRHWTFQRPVLNVNFALHRDTLRAKTIGLDLLDLLPSQFLTKQNNMFQNALAPFVKSFR